MAQTRWILRAKRWKVQRLELRLRHELWFEEVLKNLGRPFAVERNWHNRLSLCGHLNDLVNATPAYIWC